MQQERMAEGANYVPSLREYAARWALTPERLRPGQLVMHPGPMNRGVEIDARVADAAQSLVRAQVAAGLVVRMAVLYDLLAHAPGDAAAAAAGGYCAILAMPNTDPVTDSAPLLEAALRRAREEAVVPVGFYASVTKGQEGAELTEM